MSAIGIPAARSWFSLGGNKSPCVKLRLLRDTPLSPAVYTGLINLAIGILMSIRWGFWLPSSSQIPEFEIDERRAWQIASHQVSTSGRRVRLEDMEIIEMRVTLLWAVEPGCVLLLPPPPCCLPLRGSKLMTLIVYISTAFIHTSTYTSSPPHLPCVIPKFPLPLPAVDALPQTRYLGNFKLWRYLSVEICRDWGMIGMIGMGK